MFGLFDTDAKRIRRMRTEFEDIRQRVTRRMNPYEQYSFASAYEAIEAEHGEPSSKYPSKDIDAYRRTGAEVKASLQQATREIRSLSGIAAEGGAAGLYALALLSLSFSSRGYHEQEALDLQNDIDAFRNKIHRFLEGWDENSQFPAD